MYFFCVQCKKVSKAVLSFDGIEIKMTPFHSSKHPIDMDKVYVKNSNVK